MGDRYFLKITCPECGFIEDDVYFAPTCGYTEWTCPACEYIVDLVKFTGITYKDASNRGVIEQMIKAMDDVTVIEPEHKLRVKCPFCSSVSEYEWDTSKILQNEMKFFCKCCPAILWVNLMLSGTWRK